MQQQALFDGLEPARSFEPIDIHSYTTIIVFMSGGKDSIACVLHLLEIGVDRSCIELWHHDVDGRGESFMDWPVTPSYCRKLARSLNLPYYESWREGGILREMLRDNQPTAPVWAETPDGLITAGGAGAPNTRRKYPQVSASLTTRWCSGVAKIDVGAAAIRNQERFLGSRTLVVTGERAEESTARSRYHDFEQDRTHTQSRHVDHWRPVLRWTEEQVWDIMRRHGVRPHPAYFLGFSRVSCMHCIFHHGAERATERKLAPVRFAKVAHYEREFGLTIARKHSVDVLADSAKPYEYDDAMAEVALAHSYDVDIIVKPEEWVLPSGAFRLGSGPT